MSEDSPVSPRIDFNNPKAAATILLLGAPILRAIAWWEDIDFILSIREEKIAMTLQLFLDWGWLILLVVSVVWILSVRKSPVDTSKVHWGMVTSVGILAFTAGTLITVHAAGSTPMVLTGWGGDPNAQNCTAVIDTSRLVGLKDKDRLILLCGVSDLARDPIEDERIAVSQPFTITGQATAIAAPYGAMAGAVSDLMNLANQVSKVPESKPTTGLGFMLWHSVAVVPKDVNIAEIKRVSDVAKRGGKIVTEPQAGAYGNLMPILTSPLVPIPSSPLPKAKNS